MKKILTFLLLCNTSLFAQVGINTNNPNLHSNLDVNSNNGTKGIMLPKITAAQVTTLANSLTTVDKGLAFYSIDTNCFLTWEGTEFSKICEQSFVYFRLYKIINCRNLSI